MTAPCWPPTAHAVGLAVLAVLRSCASQGPVLVAVDDVQWLDEASLDALVFALRRLPAGPLSVLLAARMEAPADPLTVGAPQPPRKWRALGDPSTLAYALACRAWALIGPDDPQGRLAIAE